MNAARTALLLIAASLTCLGAARASEEVHVPKALDDWVDWVLYGEEESLCPILLSGVGAWEPQNDRRVCSWPGPLEIDAGTEGAGFELSWEIYGSSRWIALPGDALYWPEGVRIDGERARVVARGDRPHVWASPGTHRLTGSIRWDVRPQELPIDASVGLVRLRVDGRSIRNPQRNVHGLWLGERPQASEAHDHLAIHVHRLVQDDVPTRLATRLRLDVSGSVREVSLGPVLPAGLVPLSLESDLPARLEPDGRLRVQVRPGSWAIGVEAKAETVVDELTRPTPETEWVDHEIWSMQSHPELRTVMPTAERPVDPGQTEVPQEWADYPAFALDPGDALRLEERSRGEAHRDNRLRLDRTLWLDFNREAYTARDSIHGEMFTDWRLSMAPPFELLSAYDELGSDHLLVTELDDLPGRNLEIRESALSLTTLSRIPRSGRLPVSGWRQRLDEAQVKLNLPPGYRLLGATGADSVVGSWMSQWRLLDMFLALLVCVGAGRLFGRPVGALALAAMVLGAHEAGAPSWAWLNLLAATALFRFAPVGKAQAIFRGYFLLSALAVVVLLAPFTANQVKLALYPQLEYSRSVVTSADSLAAKEPTSRASSQVAVEALGYLKGGRASGSKAKQLYQRYAPDALVQTGPGIPDWRWLSYRLQWSGPIEPEETFRLWIAPPVVVSIWRLLLVATLGLLLYLIARSSLRGDPLAKGSEPSSPTPGTAAPGGVAAALLLVGTIAGSALAPAGAASAETPSAELLTELKSRLTRPAACLPDCVELLEATVRVGRETLEIDLEADALTDAAIQLPGSEKTWLPETVSLDGSSAFGLFRDEGSRYWIPLAPGRHRIALRGPLPAVASLSIPFERTPRIVTATSRSWKITGIDEHRLVSGALELTRLSEAGALTDAAQWETNRFPAYVRVRRRLVFDLDWSVETAVERIAPEEGAITMSIPLLDGESVTTQGTVVEGESVVASLSARQPAMTWGSTLSRASPLTLTSPTDGAREEVWTLGASNIWHPRTEGIPASQGEYDEGGTWEPVFHPRPGETLTIEVERPAAAGGSTLAIDSVLLATEVGARSSTSTLNFSYRSTRGTQQIIELGETARVIAVSVDDEGLSLQAEAGQLRLPIVPGEHAVSIRFAEDGASAFATRAAPVDLGLPASNVRTHLRMPNDRWILATGGDGIGPAVLYWSELAALIVLALLLGRTRWTPLESRHWFLLGLGFSTFSWGALAIVVAWLLVLGWHRRTAAPATAWRYNLLQLGLTGATVAALLTLIASVSMGLLGRPNMHISGQGSAGSSLSWFLDRTAGALPDVSVLSLPMWTYKVAILAWALWLSLALLRWLPWAWRSLSSDGLWRSMKKVEG